LGVSQGEAGTNINTNLECKTAIIGRASHLCTWPNTKEVDNNFSSRNYSSPSTCWFFEVVGMSANRGEKR